MSKAVIYTKTACGYCIRAKNILKRKSIEVEEKKIPDDISVEDAQKLLNVEFRTVPQIVIDDTYIGGYDDLCKHFDIKK